MISYLYFDISAIILLVVMLLAFCVRDIIKGRTNALFCAVVISVLVTAVFDIVSELCEKTDLIPDSWLWVRYLCDYLYFATRNISAPLFLIYVSSLLGIFYKFSSSKKVQYLCIGPYVIYLILLASNHFNHLTFYYDSNNIYHRGPLIRILGVVQVYYIVIGIVIISRYKYLVDRRRYLALMLFLPVNALAAIVQMSFAVVRVDIIIMTVLLIQIAIDVQRPEDYIDTISGTQSMNAFYYEMIKAYAAKTPIEILIFKYTNHLSLRASLGFDVYSTLVHIIAERFKRILGKHHHEFELFYLDFGTFAVVTSASSKRPIIGLAERIKEEFSRPISLNQMEVVLDGRQVVLEAPRDISSMESLVGFIGNLEDKIPGNVDIVVLEDYTSDKEFKMRNDIDQIIKRGILNKNFEMYYQPIYSIKDKKFLSAEALIRLKDEEYGFVSPGIFIPASEYSGAIHQIGNFVFEDVCRFMSTPQYKELGINYIEINLSVAQCIEYNIVKKVRGWIEAYGIKPSNINLEVTETAADYDPEITDKNISELSQMGFTFSLDDYGTGYSNIKRVVTLPLEIVKLDKSLVDSMDDPQIWIVITNTVRMLKNMNKKILVEGVEDERSLKRFEELGCDYIQGFYFSKPLPEKEFVDFVKRNNG